MRLHGETDSDEAPTEAAVVTVAGRRATIEAIGHQIDGSLRGVGVGPIVVTGEAGIGKTTLVRHLLEAVAPGTTTVLVQADAHRAMQPLEVFRHAHGLPVTVAAVLAEPLRALDDRGSFVPEMYRVIDALLDAFERSALERPVVLVVEDHGWLDPASRVLVAGITRRLRHLPIAVVLTDRTASTPDAPAWVRSPGNRDDDHGTLGPMDRADVAELVAERRGRPAGVALLDALGIAGGNPMFLTQLLDGIDAHGGLDRFEHDPDSRPLLLPATLTHAVAQRLADESPDDRSLLTVAALLGTGFETADLSVLTGRSALELLPIVMRLIHHGVFVADDGAIRFRHELIRQVLYDEVPPDLRRRVHLDVGRALAAAGRPAITAAHHLLLGAESGDVDVVPLLRQAAVDTARMMPSIAVDLLSAACRIVPVDDPGRLALEVELVDARFWCFDNQEASISARELLSRQLTTAQAVTLRSHLAAWDLYRGDTARSVETMLGTLELEGLDELERARATGTAAICAAVAGDMIQAGRLAGTVFDTDATLDREAHGLAHCAMVMVDGVFGHGDEVRRHATSARELLDGIHVRTWQPFAALGLTYVDEFDAARAVVRDARESAERDGRLWEIPSLAIVPMMLAFLDGNWDEALAEAETVLDLADEFRFGAQMNWPWTTIAAISLFRGDRQRCERASAACADVVGRGGNHVGVDWIAWIKALMTEEDDPGASCDLLHLVWCAYIVVGATIQSFMAPDLLRMAMASGRGELVAHVVDELEAMAQKNPTPTMLGLARWCRGLHTDDAAALVEASELLRRSPRLLARARAFEDASAALERGDERVRALSLLREAIEIYERLGARRELTRANVQLARLGGRARRRTGERFGWDSLTETERAVVDLAVDGFSNAEIGARLHMSRRTVETHLTHVYTKLELSGRVQLATAASQRRNGGTTAT